MKYRYRAFDRGGKAREDVIEAASDADARELLRREGLFVSEMAPAGERDAAPARARRSWGGGGSRLTRVAAFMRHLAVLVGTGTPLVDALAAIELQARDEAWRTVLVDVRRRVEDGSAFSEALAAHPHYFDTVCRSLVRAGESGGKLDVMLKRLAELTRQQVKVRQTLIGALVYPILLIGVAVGVLGVMLGFVMPRFQGLFESLDAPLPPTTQVLMSVSNFLVGYWWAVSGAFAAVFGSLLWWLRTEQGRLTMGDALLNAPQLGKVLRSLATARIARLLGTLLESRVPMLECIELAREASPNARYAALLSQAHDSLAKGESLSSALGAGTLISPSVCEAVRNAERTGQVGPVLSSMADFLDEENEVIIKSLTSILEPLILITLGLVVGFVAISMFLPLFDLTATAGGGGGGGGGGP